MDNEEIVKLLAEARTACFKALSDHIVELVNIYEVPDDAIKKLIDERRMVEQEFTKRIAIAEANLVDHKETP